MPDPGLYGTTVLVTRPPDQAGELIDAIESCGGNTIVFPVIEIVPYDAGNAETAPAELAPADITIFVSTNAVRYGHHLAEGQVAAVGPATAAALEDSGKPVHIVPASGFDSESLLDETDLRAVAGKRVRIVRGTDGRELLATTLRKRGANVDFVPVYERRLPEIERADYSELRSALAADDIDVVTVMSVASLNNLYALVRETDWSKLEKVPLVTPALRVIKEAQHRYPELRTVLAHGIAPADLVAAICACKESTSERPHE